VGEGGKESAPQRGLVGTADMCDALTHERPYKGTWPVSEALAEIARGAGRQFDPDAAAAFTDLVASQPSRLMPDRYAGSRESEAS
jgi:putative two-component system response regulator